MCMVYMSVVAQRTIVIDGRVVGRKREMELNLKKDSFLPVCLGGLPLQTVFVTNIITTRDLCVCFFCVVSSR